jgi:hypothetical protein
MGAQYRFQKQQVQDQITARMQEAARHRMTKAAQAGRPGFLSRLSLLLNSSRSVSVRWRHGSGPDSAMIVDETVAREQLV